MHDIDLTAKVNKIIRFALPSLILVAAIIGYAEFRYWHRSETIRLDNAKVAGTMVSVRVLTTGKVKELVFDDGAQLIGNILLDALKNLAAEQTCACRELRKETLLKEIYDAGNATN